MDAEKLIEALGATDSWQNLATNMGVVGKDKAQGTRFRQSVPLSFHELDAIINQDGIGALIVGDKVDDAMRGGWTISFAPSKEDSVDPELVNDINNRLNAWHKRTGFITQSMKHLKGSRGFGGSLFVLGVSDGGEEFEELVPERVTEFTYVKAFDRFQTRPSIDKEINPESLNYDMPLSYTLELRTVGTRRLSAVGDEPVTVVNLDGLVIHSSRTWRTDGVVTSDRGMELNEGWGRSVLERAYDPLRNFNAGMSGVGTVLHDFMQGVYSLNGLAELISGGNEALVYKRFRVVDRTKGIANAILIDAQNESYTRNSPTVTGLPELIDRTAHHLSAVSREPMTRLFGLSPGGFGTGEGDSENWNKEVSAYRQSDLRPMLEYVYGLLFQTKEFSDVPDGWMIEFPDLDEPSSGDTATTRKTNADADAVYINSGVLDPNEVAESRFGGAEYGVTIDLDREARELNETGDRDGTDEDAARLNAEAEKAIVDQSQTQIQPEEPLPEDVQKSALNGAQIAGLQQMVLSVASGDLPLESGVAMAKFDFPTMSDEEARAMFEPAAKALEEEQAEAASRPSPVPPPTVSPSASGSAHEPEVE